MGPKLGAVFGVGFFFVSALVLAGCGGSGYGSMPAAPSSGGGSATTANVTIMIVGSSGSQAFSPNPATVGTNQTLVFRNTDATTHRIVADAGAFDSGNIGPSVTSAPITIASANSTPFHCTIHPSMVGGINTSSTSSGSGSGDPGSPY